MTAKARIENQSNAALEVITTGPDGNERSRRKISASGEAFSAYLESGETLTIQEAPRVPAEGDAAQDPKPEDGKGGEASEGPKPVA